LSRTHVRAERDLNRCETFQGDSTRAGSSAIRLTQFSNPIVTGGH
jgi:hypothetical protein